MLGTLQQRNCSIVPQTKIRLCISENLWQLGIVSPSVKEPMVAMYGQSVMFSGLVFHGKNQMNLPEVELQVLKFLNNLFCGILLNIFQNI